MPETPDPLGKRALFWAPAQRQEAGPLRPGGKRVLPGRHALFSGGDSATAATTTTTKKNGATRTPAARTQTARTQLSAGSRPTFADRPASAKKVSAKVKKATPSPRVAPPPAVGDAQTAVGGKTGSGPINLSCSKCGTETDVDVVKYLVLHMPYWVWRPGRGYTSLMKCPACGKRTWVSASWASKHR